MKEEETRKDFHFRRLTFEPWGPHMTSDIRTPRQQQRLLQFSPPPSPNITTGIVEWARILYVLVASKARPLLLQPSTSLIRNKLIYYNRQPTDISRLPQQPDRSKVERKKKEISNDTSQGSVFNYGGLDHSITSFVWKKHHIEKYLSFRCWRHNPCKYAIFKKRRLTTSEGGVGGG